jgi:2-desacetyl-2-hydroxyethyl bacteriochlorophyllide A dehydrogenase
VDIVADTVATHESVELGLRLLRHDGQMVLNGYYREGYHLLSIQALHEKEITVHNPSGWTRPRLEATLALIESRRMEVEDLVTHVVQWEQAAEAYKRLVWNKEEEFLGIVIIWNT